MRPVAATLFAISLFQRVIDGQAFHSTPLGPTGGRGSHTSRPLRGPDIGSSVLWISSRSSEQSQQPKQLVDDPEATQDATRLAAIAALQRLQARQEQELGETVKLLAMVEREYEKSGHDADDDDAASSTAASLLSGFDYGFVSRSEGAPSALINGAGGMLQSIYGGPPGNLWSVGWQQFMLNLNAMRGEYADEESPVSLTPRQAVLQEQLKQLRLNTTEIWAREFADGPIEAPFVIKIPYLAVCFLLDVVFDGKYVPSRFFLLETVARMPYFSYIAMLHLYETLGFWRRSADVKRIHFAEELNEYRHLLIMESLAGDQAWWVRFVAQHSAIVYFYVLCLLFAISPTLSYRFSELLETHAVNTYGVFLDDNEEMLKEMPPPMAAVEYYTLGAADPFYAEFQTAALASGLEIRRPGEKMTSLYDVFSAIKSDEKDHVSTMIACLDPDIALQSPSMERRILFGVALMAMVPVIASLSSGGGAGVDLVTDDAAIVVSDGAATSMAEMTAAGIMGMAGRMLDESSSDVEALLEEGGALAIFLERGQAILVAIGEALFKLL